MTKLCADLELMVLLATRLSLASPLDNGEFPLGNPLVVLITLDSEGDSGMTLQKQLGYPSTWGLPQRSAETRHQLGYWRRKSTSLIGKRLNQSVG